jgi:DUF971 family protein
VSRLGTLPIVGQPNPNEPKDVHLVGRYAVGITWADGHGSIYPFDQLRRSCRCGTCGDTRPVTPEMTWPREIKKLGDGLGVDWSDGHPSVFPYPELRAGCRCATCTGGH